MKLLNEEARWKALNRLPAYNAVEYLPMESVNEWLGRAKEITRRNSKAMGMKKDSGAGYTRSAQKILQALCENNERAYCSVPVDMLFWLHIIAAGPEERSALAEHLYRSHRYAINLPTGGRKLSVDEYPLAREAKASLYGEYQARKFRGTTALACLFQAVQLALINREMVDVGRTLDEVIAGFGEEWVQGLDIWKRREERSRFTELSPAIPGHAVYRLYRKTGEFLGTQLFCTARIASIQKIMNFIFNNSCCEGRQKLYFANIKLVTYKLICSVEATLSEDLQEAKKMGIVYAREVLF